MTVGKVKAKVLRLLCSLGRHRDVRKTRTVTEGLAEFECGFCGARLIRLTATEESRWP